MGALRRANRHVLRAAGTVNPAFRPSYHAAAPAGWINDPNGLCWHRGECRLFYQHNPFAPRWGRMYWGQCASKDMLSWEHRPIVLAPDRCYDGLLGCFSGTSVEVDGALALMYTGVSAFGQLQCLAVSQDGSRFRKVPGNPVIRKRQLPPNASPADFRDPKVFRRDGAFWCLAGARDRDKGTGMLLLFRSTDLRQWKYVGEAWSSSESPMLECPDLCALDGHDVLICSPTSLARRGDEFQNLHSVVYCAGRLDTESGRFEGPPCREIDSGFDFYAAQTCALPDGRTILIAWMQMWKRSMPTAELGHGWAGSMTLPRELSLVDGRLRQAPVREIGARRRNAVVHADLRFSGELSLAGVEGARIELAVKADLREARSFEIRFFRGGKDCAVARYETESGRMVLDRGACGVPIRNVGGKENDTTRAARIALKDGILDLRLFLDRSSAEVFLQDGEATMTATMYPAEDATGIGFRAEGTARLLRVEKYDIVV